MRGDHGHRLGSRVLQHVACARDGTGGVDQVIDKHAVLALDIADHTVGDRLVRAGDVASLVHESERTAAETLRPLLGHANAAGVGGDDGDVVEMALETITDVVDQHRHGHQMIDRAVEEALGLRGMQIDRHDAVGTGGLQQVEHQTAGDGLAAAVLLVLTGVAEQRADRSNGTGRGALQCVDHDELLHDRLVDGFVVALQHEHIGATHRFGVAHVHLAVGEIVCGGFKDVDAELLGDILSQLRMNPSRNENKILIGLPFKDCAHHVSQRVVSSMQSSA